MTDFPESKDSDVAEYRALSVSAVGGLVFGLLSPLVFAHPLLWSFPFAGALLSGGALWKIRRQEAILAGRTAARWGLGLSLIFAAAGPTDWLVSRWQREGEARRFAALFFELLARREPEKAFQLTQDPSLRQPLDGRLWDYYRRAPHWRLKLEQFVAPAEEGQSPPLVRTLLALGDSARTRYLKTFGHFTSDTLQIVDQLYAVTYSDREGKKTFFAILRLARKTTPDGKAAWRILRAVGGEKLKEPA
jgi:hypothetical protein